MSRTNLPPVTHAEARKILSRFNASHWNNRSEERARYSIPARPEHDDDLRLAQYITQNEDDAAKLLDALEEMAGMVLSNDAHQCLQLLVGELRAAASGTNNDAPATAEQTVHILRRGTAMCPAGMPLEWPQDRWVRFTAPNAIIESNCAACINALDAHRARGGVL